MVAIYIQCMSFAGTDARFAKGKKPRQAYND